MPTASISVAYVNPPKPGKKMGSIKTNEGEYFGVWPDKLSMFAPGQAYDIEYDVNERGYKNFKRFAGSVSVGTAARGATTGMVRTMSGNSQSGTKSEEMFVMSMLGKAVQGAGTVPDSMTIAQWVEACITGWRRGVAEANKPAGSLHASAPVAEMDDEIPF